MPQYMLMFVGERRTKEDMDRGMAAVGQWWEANKAVIKGGERLDVSKTATTVKRVNGQMKVFDGPFIEAKEQVGGYALVEVPDCDARSATRRRSPSSKRERRHRQRWARTERRTRCRTSVSS